MPQANLRILANVPNIIGYFRIFLIFLSASMLTLSESRPTDESKAALEYSSTCLLALAIYSLAALLDIADGFAARRLNQISAFGEWLDVVVDVIGRTMLWHIANVKFLSFMIPCIEWLTFCCTHAQFGSMHWKARFSRENAAHRSAPSFVQKVFARAATSSFATPHGIFALGGVHCLPIAIVAAKQLPLITPQTPFLISFTSLAALFVLSSGRTYAALCEFWFIADHVRCLLTGPQQMINQDTISAIRRQSQSEFFRMMQKEKNGE